MLPEAALQAPGTGKLADNVLHFARVLRRAGLPVGTDQALLALQALQLVGLGSRHELHDVLQACLINRGEHRVLFDQAFHVFWRDTDLLAEILRTVPKSSVVPGALRLSTNQRLMDALLYHDGAARSPREAVAERLALQTQTSWSDRERLRNMDFESMSTEEWLAAQRAVAALATLLPRLRTRRDLPSRHGARPDLRRLLRDSGRYGGDVAELPRRARRTRTVPLCVIVDISGSMSRYSRMFLHFMHALMNGARATDLRVNAFVFGTRLTHITGQLKCRDPDDSGARVAKRVEDWGGGTRIGPCLKEFNQRWVRRLPLGNSTVLLVTDGLEQAQIELLAEQSQRLSRSCRCLLWLNPLLRYESFEPKARGMRALLPHVDRMLPIHNIASLEQLVLALESPPGELLRWK